MSSSYIETLQLIDNTVAAEASDASVFADYCEGASRLFDMLCEVEREFFNAYAGVSVGATVKTFDGTLIDMLRLPPFVAGSITLVDIDGTTLGAADYKVRTDYLINKTGDFDGDSVISVTAHWGFSEIPAEVKIVVQELANYLWRQRDPMFAEQSEIEIEKNLSPTTNAIIKKFRDKYSQGAF